MLYKFSATGTALVLALSLCSAPVFAQSCTPVGADGQTCISDGPSHKTYNQTFGHHSDISFNNACERYVDVRIQTSDKKGHTSTLSVTVPPHGSAGWGCDELAGCVDLSVIGPVCKDGSDSQGAQASPPAAKATSVEDLEQARQAADDAKQKALDAIAAAQRKQQDEAAQKQRLKDEAKALPEWCSGMVRACRQRVDSLSDTTSETRSQCTAYCQNLQIQDCDGSSDLINQTAQACNDGIMRDRKTVSEVIRRHRQQAKIRQSIPDPDERPVSPPKASEWTCFSSYESCTGYCMAQTGATGTAGWCGGICSGSGTGNRPQPAEYGSQYCYHAPETPAERASVY